MHISNFSFNRREESNFIGKFKSSPSSFRAGVQNNYESTSGELLKDFISPQRSRRRTRPDCFIRIVSSLCTRCFILVAVLVMGEVDWMEGKARKWKYLNINKAEEVSHKSLTNK